MKTKKEIRGLRLNKKTIAHLNQEFMKRIGAGAAEEGNPIMYTDCSECPTDTPVTTDFPIFPKLSIIADRCN